MRQTLGGQARSFARCNTQTYASYGQPIFLPAETTPQSTSAPTPHTRRTPTSDPKSEFQRALLRLGVAHPFAPTPQAKGKIERRFDAFHKRLLQACWICAFPFGKIAALTPIKPSTLRVKITKSPQLPSSPLSSFIILEFQF